MATLEDAILLAVRAHFGHEDRYGVPYILHPLRVMHRMQSQAEMTAAVLHDVVEDTDFTLADLREAGYSAEVVEAVDRLSRRENETYEEYIERLKPNPLARKVKLADLEDNMDVRRIKEPQANDWERLKRYRRAWLKLSAEEV